MNTSFRFHTDVDAGVLWNDGDLLLRRGWRLGRDGCRSAALVLLPASERPSAVCLNRLAHEFGLKDELEGDWAVLPLELAYEGGRSRLVLEDPGGEPLRRLLGKPVDIESFLRFTIRIAAAIGKLHQHGLVHKDIKPEHILANCPDGRVRLMGFGLASRLPREHQAPAPPETIAGTLAYMAPEQTGRMNHSVDYRSDLYSLGVTFYQMLTGALPFTASDPMEWAHCHVARQPLAPSEVRDDVPKPLSQLVIKLLAKTPEERYQTAAGVEHDLQRCLTDWERWQRIDEFPLGQCDMADRLLIPEKLYGRDHEVKTLLACFDRIAKGGAPELVLVSGYSGIGKSSVVNEIHRVLVLPRGLFAAGKFDQHKRDIPYATLAQVFLNLIRPLLSKSETELAGWRNALMAALGPNAGLIANLIPELRHIIGDPPPIPELEPRQAQSRFQLVLRRFISVFAQPAHPLVLFLDDLQWLDAATIDLLEDLLTRPDVRHLMLIGAYRDNEVDSAHPLMRKLDAIRRAGAPVRDIRLRQLASDDLSQLVADALRCDPAHVAPLSQLVHEKTMGNPFFVIQFLHSLAETGLLYLDHGAMRWRWDLDHIHAEDYTDNVVDLMVYKLKHLPAETQQALQQLACVGNVAAFAMLSIVLGAPEEQLHAVLWPAVRQELVERLDGSYRFMHDRVQEAAYSLIPQHLCAGVHLRIGRLLVGETPCDNLEEAIFAIVNQLNRGAALIDEQEERDYVAELNLIAGRRAKGSTAYASALIYLDAAAMLLAHGGWERRRDLMFPQELIRAECEFLAGQLSMADERLAALANRTTTTIERAGVACLHMDVFTTLDQAGRAVAVCLDYLRHLGIEWSPYPSEEVVRSEYERIEPLLASRTIEDLINLPPMQDPVSLATVEVLSKLEPSAWYTDWNLAAWAVCKAVTLSLEHGTCGASCVAYVLLGRIAGPRFGDYDTGFRFGHLGYQLVERRGFKRFEPSTYLCFANFVLPWMKHVRACRDLLRRAFDAANEIGDLVMGAGACSALTSGLLFAGEPLLDVQAQAERGLAFAEKARFGFVTDLITTQLALIRALRGMTLKFGCFDDGQFNEERTESLFCSKPASSAACWHWTRKLQARYLAGDYAAAVDAGSRVQPALLSHSYFLETEYHFYGALAEAAYCHYAPAGERQQHLAAVAVRHKRLEAWAQNCPENFENRAALVGAEIARLECRYLDAESLYEQAIRSAHDNGFVHNEATAYERASDFYRARGFDQFADVYLRNARYCYLRWGADAKVRQLEEMYPQLRDQARAPAPSGAIGASVQDLDLGTVVKVSQAVSREIVLEKMLDELMRTAIAQAGATRGLLILAYKGELRIAAQATTFGDTVRVELPDVPVPVAVLPETILQYVLRTRETVKLDDAATEAPFAGDPYIRRTLARSILCLPLMNQAKLIGVLYLENNLARRVFALARVAVLEVLASQAAISIENAALYTDLQLQVGVLQQLPVSAWTLKPDGTPDFVNQVWLEFAGQTLEFARSNPEAWMTAVHPEDREMAASSFWRGVRSGQGFSFETRSLRARDKTYRWHLQQAVVLRDAEGKVIKFVGTTTDIDDQKRTEEALRQAQGDLARINRVTTMGELAASLAHEISQPITGAMTNAEVSLRKLEKDNLDLDAARVAVARIVRDARRATDIIGRIRSQFEKRAPNQETLNVNEIFPEIIALLRAEASQYDISVRTELAGDLPRVLGDRVQLQQVAMNLIINGIDAMKQVDGPREMRIRSQAAESGQILISVSDTGVGFSPQMAEKIFAPFYTTKPHGTGMGLRISRSIIESHNGRLWAVANPGRGATFNLVLPAAGT